MNESSNSDCILLDSSLAEGEPAVTGAAAAAASAAFSNTDSLEVIRETVCCPLCFETVDAVAGLEAHFAHRHSELDCPFCSEVFDNASALNSHVDSTHSSELARDVNDHNMIVEETIIEFECPVCALLTKDKHWLERHVESHFNATATVSASSSSSEPRTSDSTRLADADYQLALSVHELETKRLTEASKASAAPSAQDSVRAQLAERKMNEARKFKMSKGTVYGKK
jgi:uncharacterized C2H2 Zn-finger protein